MKRLAATAALACAAACPTAALAQFTVNPAFSNATMETGWATTVNSGGFTPFLTASTGLDTPGQGWLRLTGNGSNSNSTLVRLTGQSFPPTQGVFAEFEYVMWKPVGAYSGSNAPADGMTFFLYDATKNMAGAQLGQGLGYCHGDGAYLGVGFDTWGNFLSGQRCDNIPHAQFTIGGPTGRTHNTISVRGPSNASPQNPFVAKAAQEQTGKLGLVGTSASPLTEATRTVRKAQVLLIPNGSGGYTVTVRDGPSGGALTEVIANANFNYAAPSQLSVGFSASTGSAHQHTEVRMLKVRALADIKTEIAMTSPATLYQTGGPDAQYTVTVTNKPGSPAQSGENAPQTTITLPAGLDAATLQWLGCTASAGSACPTLPATGSVQTAANAGGTLAANGTWTFTLRARPDAAAACGSTHQTTASADFLKGFADTDITDNQAASAAFTLTCGAAPPPAPVPADNPLALAAGGLLLAGAGARRFGRSGNQRK